MEGTTISERVSGEIEGKHSPESPDLPGSDESAIKLSPPPTFGSDTSLNPNDLASTTNVDREDDDAQIIDEVLNSPREIQSHQKKMETNRDSGQVSKMDLTDSKKVNVTITVSECFTGRVLQKPLTLLSDVATVNRFLQQHHYIRHDPTPVGSLSGGERVRKRAFGEMESSSTRHKTPKPDLTLLERKPSTFSKEGNDAAPSSYKKYKVTSTVPVRSSTSIRQSSPPTTDTINRIPSKVATYQKTSPYLTRQTAKTLHPENIMTNEQAVVVPPKLQKGRTIWGTIEPNAKVFVRWEDDTFYSGVVDSKGEGNSWKIVFDDGGDETVVHALDIMPIRIIGVGTQITYPANSRRPRDATVIGQKLEMDNVSKIKSEMYAIKCEMEDELIWASRKELCFSEYNALLIK